MALLEVHDVVAGYVEGIDVLTGVSVAVERGSITGVIGANGAGKSTLLKTIFGFLHPRRGRIVLDGHEIQARPPPAESAGRELRGPGRQRVPAAHGAGKPGPGCLGLPRRPRAHGRHAGARMGGLSAPAREAPVGAEDPGTQVQVFL